MIKVRFAARVRNEDIQETWNGFYDILRPFELRSHMTDAPAYTFEDEAKAKAFIKSELPRVDADALAEPGGSRFAAPREYDEASGEWWTRTALIERS